MASGGQTALDLLEADRRRQLEEVRKSQDEDAPQSRGNGNADAEHLDDLMDQMQNGLASDSSPPKMTTTKAPTGMRGYLSHIIEGQLFKRLIGLAILLNAIQLGMAVELSGPNWQWLWTMCEHMFTFIFATEMVLKVFCLRLNYFKDAWNIADFIVAWIAILDLWVLSMLISSAELSKITVIRLFRLMRLTRVMKVLKLNHELLVIVEGFAASLRSMVWITIVLLVVLYAASVFCVQIIGNSELPYIEETGFDTELFFGHIHSSMISLFGVLLLAEWATVVRPMWELQPQMVLFFVFFVIVTSFGLMNVIIGIISESTAEVAEKKKADELLAHRTAQMANVRNLTAMVFGDEEVRDGNVTQDEFINCKAALTGKVKEVLTGVDLPHGFGMKDLHRMLDLDCDGCLSESEFSDGLFRLIFSTDFHTTCVNQLLIQKINREVTSLREQVVAAFQDIDETIKSELSTLRREFGKSQDMPLECNTFNNMFASNEVLLEGLGRIRQAARQASNSLEGIEANEDCSDLGLRSDKVNDPAPAYTVSQLQKEFAPSERATNVVSGFAQANCMNGVQRYGLPPLNESQSMSADVSAETTDTLATRLREASATTGGNKQTTPDNNELPELLVHQLKSEPKDNLDRMRFQEPVEGDARLTEMNMDLVTKLPRTTPANDGLFCGRLRGRSCFAV
eukprot:gnl/TRDRNA2_/TRDRNA2_157485_c2_seq1.p1 gnl/TRDRNA2_/TRDRNA2_157485_c2~~gnl/TRDRNA2_/TRDRNA2_157485_c2_seq1.p1  ORF type:complete len:682 (-),score=122.31 gnl/TRDRNA2_/TRDRNA2_157485_c2_seq1:81-2126(-)